MLIALLKDSSRRVNLKRNLTFIFNSNLQTTTVSERLNLRSSLGLNGIANSSVHKRKEWKLRCLKALPHRNFSQALK